MSLKIKKIETTISRKIETSINSLKKNPEKSIKDSVTKVGRAVAISKQGKYEGTLGYERLADRERERERERERVRERNKENETERKKN